MKSRIGILGLLLGLVLPAVFVCPPGLYGEDTVYTVLKGETFYSIARSFGVNAGELMDYNGVADPVRLQAGQRLKIPGSREGSAASAGRDDFSYQVVRGDTLYGISRKYSLSVDALRKANDLSPDYLLRAGDSLVIPVNGGGKAEPALPGNSGVASTPPKPPVKAAETSGEGTAPAPGVDMAAALAMRWPVTVKELSYMTGKVSGVGITGMDSESVQSLTRGTVLSAGPFLGFGKVVIVQVDGGYLYVYGGCKSLSVREGDKVGPGMELGKLGIDGVSNKPLLFFMVYRSDSPVDPAKAPRA